MPINREKELLFIHVPKTGGTKIEEILGMKYAGDNPDVSGEKLNNFFMDARSKALDAYISNI